MADENTEQTSEPTTEPTSEQQTSEQSNSETGGQESSGQTGSGQESSGQTSEQSSEVGADQVQSSLDKEQEQGYRGTATDETPNHAYTVEGVLAGEETPETRQNEESS